MKALRSSNLLLICLFLIMGSSFIFYSSMSLYDLIAGQQSPNFSPT
ncbi:MAG: hypothetical protein LE169_00870 [Endomicrobium sp.]|nr:hypothetical protein [Endomicrobium sp.]